MTLPSFCQYIFMSPPSEWYFIVNFYNCEGFQPLGSSLTRIAR
jgi:hypothetical protein